MDSRFRAVGKLVRREAQKLIVGYTFDLRTNTLKPESVDNPAAGTEHNFVAYRLKGSVTDAGGYASTARSYRKSRGSSGGG